MSAELILVALYQLKITRLRTFKPKFKQKKRYRKFCNAILKLEHKAFNYDFSLSNILRTRPVGLLRSRQPDFLRCGVFLACVQVLRL